MGRAARAIPLDAEGALDGAPADDHAELRLWLRLLACANLVEGEIRRRLREGHATTLPRFDFMAQLHRAPEGLTLGEVSRRMMVSNGNVTALADRLVAEGLVARRPAPGDRRAALVALTAAGRAVFAAMAAPHEAWVRELFAGLRPGEAEGLMQGLGHLKASVRAATGGAA